MEVITFNIQDKLDYILNGCCQELYIIEDDYGAGKYRYIADDVDNIVHLINVSLRWKI